MSFRPCHELFRRVFLGAGPVPAHAPPAWLVLVWLAFGLARLYPASFSLWEDEIWNLVVTIDAPWKTALGISDYNSINHILHSVAAKALIKTSGHHGVEFVFRIPSLAAAFLAMPMGFAAFSALAGRGAGITGSLLLAVLPAVNYHAANARGYAVWLLLVLWAMALLAEPRGKPPWIRLGLAYFLAGLSHGLGLVSVAMFAAAGLWLGKGGVTPRKWAANAALAVPVFLYCIPVLAVMGIMGERVRPEGSWSPVRASAFLADWFEYQFGALHFSGWSFGWAALMLGGFLAMAARRESRPRALALAAMGLAIPLAFILKNHPETFVQYSMGGLPFWLAWISAGLAGLSAFLRRRFLPESVREPAIGAAIAVALVLPLVPRVLLYLSQPKQDYRGLVKAYARDFPGQPLFGISPVYETGLAYYCRRAGIGFHILGDTARIRERLFSSPEARALAVLPENDASREVRDLVEKDMRVHAEFAGTQMPIRLHVPAGRAGKPQSPGRP